MITNEKLLDVYKLKNLIRYNNRTKLTNESVAEHSFFVALLSIICIKEFKLSEDILEKVLIKALLHDMPEIEIDDITYDAKQKLQINDLLRQHEIDYYKRNFAEYVDLMSETDDIVSLVVEYADALSVRQFCLHERRLGNKANEIKVIYDETQYRLNRLSKEIRRLKNAKKYSK